MKTELVKYLEEKMQSWEPIPLMVGPYRVSNAVVDEVHVREAYKHDRMELVDVHLTFMQRTDPTTLKAEALEERRYQEVQENSGVPSMLRKDLRSERRKS